MGSSGKKVWRHECKVLHALSYQWEDTCDYCGVTRKEEMERRARRSRREEEDGSDSES